jgi:exosortase/archaeosortase family protein
VGQDGGVVSREEPGAHVRAGLRGVAGNLLRGHALAVFSSNAFPSYLRWNARVSNVMLNWLGQVTTVTGSSIFSGRFSIDVRRGCDAIEPSVLFLSGVLAFPSPFLRKLPGIVIGTLVLLAVNLVRIVSLFLTGVYYPKGLSCDARGRLANPLYPPGHRLLGALDSVGDASGRASIQCRRLSQSGSFSDCLFSSWPC